MSLFLHAARDYVALGWRVFPLAAGSKIPAIKKGQGFKQATADHTTIAEWGRRFPHANIGIATGEVSGITVIDIDPRNGGGETITKLAAQNLLLPWAPEARTGNNGRHVFFAYDPRIRASKDRLGPGIDVKTDGGYVVAAPSIIRPSEQGPGGPYSWMVKPDGAPLPHLPAWLVERLLPPPEPQRQAFVPMFGAQDAERALDGMARKLAAAPVGERNSLLNWCAYRAGAMVRQRRLTEQMVVARLTQAALSVGLSASEIRSTLASGLKGV
jgi:hypothetical protein